MRVLVTGASGCLGRALVRRLQRDGHAVRGLARGQRPLGEIWSEVQWTRCDLRDGPVNEAVADCGAVVHLAGLVHSPGASAQDLMAVNTEAAARLMQAARAAGIPGHRFLFSSTVAVYGSTAATDEIFDEDSPVDPDSAYAESKWRAEASVRENEGVVLRLPVCYGPGDRGNIGRMVRAIRARRFVLPSPANSLRSILAAENFAEAVTGLLTCSPREQTYVITDAVDVSLPEIVSAIVAALPNRPWVPEAPLSVVKQVAWVGTRLAAAGLPWPLTEKTLRKLVSGRRFSSARIQREIGYQPPRTLRSAMKSAVQLRVRKDSTP